MEKAMSAVEAFVQTARREAREKRAKVFRETFSVGPSTRILDLGSEDGAAIAAVLAGTGAQPSNIYIADINAERVQQGHRRYGFSPIAIPAAGTLPFEDGYFDIVYCSSVIEHVTLPKDQIWLEQSDEEFERRARTSQRQFANEIRRLGRGYYVQTPDRWFPIESHTWLPLVGYMPRTWQKRVIEKTNRYWVKKTNPDWCLLSAKEMQEFFPDATIRHERFMGLSKSIMAIKS
jgi:SAM-dependent methyltransferase